MDTDELMLQYWRSRVINNDSLYCMLFLFAVSGGSMSLTLNTMRLDTCKVTRLV